MRAFPPSFYSLQAGAGTIATPLAGPRRADVCIVGAGFTGLSAALHLAEAGVDVVLLEADTIASGASGRNGGQIHSGLRRDVLWLEQKFGFARAKLLWDLCEDAKALLRSLIVRFAIACDLRPGVIEAQHKPYLMKDAAKLVEALRGRFGYTQIGLLDREDAVAALGSQRFYGGIDDSGGGHLDPHRFALGLARAGMAAGASLHELTPATSYARRNGRIVVATDRGEVDAERLIVATDGRSGTLERHTRRRMVGLNSFMVVTGPLGERGRGILPEGQSAADSRYVVRYWRKTQDDRLIFGGGESNAGHVPQDIGAFVRPHLGDIYPQLADIGFVHAWGGVVSVTALRLPFVREVEPDVWTAGGYSGQGVALAPFLGQLLAEAVRGQRERIEPFTALPVPALPTATWLRRSLVTLALWRGRIADRL